ncbi:MAG: Gfo/Idh/MocA family protein [Candidatus Aminicenantales bacterium]
MKKISRRKFLEDSPKTVAAAAGFLASFHPGSSASSPLSPQTRKKVSPNDKISIALIGSGGMGKTDLSAFLSQSEVECLAVADVDEKHLAEGIELAEKARQKKPDGYKDFRRIIDRKDIQAVVIATPDHWHALPTIYACQTEKDVYVEKPLATTIAEGRAMVNAARTYKRIVQVGTQQRSAKHFLDAVSFVQSGQLGRIRLVRAWAYLDWKGSIGSPPDESPPPHLDYDFWLGPAPQRPYNPMRVHHNFRWFWDYSGGLATDWGAHMVDVVLWAMNEEPLSAASTGGKFGFPEDLRETPDTQQALIKFSTFSLLWEHMIGCGVGPWQREHGVEFHGENGICVVDRGGWEVYSETDKFKQAERVFRLMPKPRQGVAEDFHLAHIQNFIECIKTRQKPRADVEIGHKSIAVCHLANMAYRLERTIRWNPEKEAIIGDPQAQRLVDRPYRKPWALPKISL